MDQEVLEITEEQLNFIKSEFGLTLDDLNNLDDAGLEKLYNSCAKIEIEESMQHPDEETDRCRIAADIVDLLSM